MKIVLIIVSVLAALLAIGCAALSSYVTPAEIDKPSVVYVVNAGLTEPNAFAGYPNLYKAEKLKTALDNAHTAIQWKLSNQVEWDNLVYSQRKGIVADNLTMAQQREEMLFGPQGLLTLGLGIVGAGGLGGVIGLMRKRPGDISQDEAQAAVAQAVGKSANELTEKQKQFTELVLGISKMFTTVKTLPVSVQINGTEDEKEKKIELLNQLSATLTDKFKALLDETQDTSTKDAVAAVKNRTIA